MSEVRNLEPQVVWNHFEDLNEVPRPSKKEERVIAFMKKFGADLGLPVKEDKTGNVIITKPATEGMEDRKVVVLQAHLDMVHQKNRTTDFDFNTEGIRSYIDNGWVKAEGTTLGADNGMGVAAIMAILSSTDIPHPAIEALFTVDEETGMTGAFGLEPGNINGDILLNLDTEEDWVLTIGCAGGVDTNTFLKYNTIDAQFNQGIELNLNGLAGGHSGGDINTGRANANKLLARFLYEVLEAGITFELVGFDGGSLRNAIPREASCTLNISQGDLGKLEALLSSNLALYQANYAKTDPNMVLTLNAVEKFDQAIEENQSKSFIYALEACFNGVYRMSTEIENLVETSSSLARVLIKDGSFTTQSLQRGAIDDAKLDVAHRVGACFKLIGATVEHNGEYPGWQPNTNSEILDLMVAMYKERFNESPVVEACHAGLECGIIGGAYKQLDMISFGPTIRNPHSPDEKVEIASVQKFWGFFLEVLKATPKK